MERKTKVSLLCLIILVLLLSLSILQHLNLLPLSNLWVMVIYFAIFLVPIFFYTARSGKKAKNLLRLSHIRVKHLPFTILFGISVTLICGLLNILGATVFSFLPAEGQSTALLDFSTQNPLVLFLTMVLLPAVTEELLLRGVVLGELEYYGSLRAVLVSALVFALFHANPVTLVSLFVAGICFGVLTLLFDSIWPAMLCHMLNNAVALAISTNREYITYILSDPLFIILTLAAVFLILIAALKLLEGVIRERTNRGKLRYVKRKKGTNPLISLPMLLFLVGCVGKMLVTYFM